MFCTATWFAVVSFCGKGIEHVLHRNQVCSGLILWEAGLQWSHSPGREGIEHVLHRNQVCRGLIRREGRVLNMFCTATRSAVVSFS